MSRYQKPLVSIITVTLNSAKFLEQAFRSVENQTYKNLEYIVIDGKSTDGTLDIIKKHEGFISRWVSEPDKNMYEAINRGLSIISGEFCGILNSDDYYFPDTVSKVVNCFMRHQDKGAVTGGIQFVDTNNNNLYKLFPPRFNVKSMLRMKTNGIVAHPATFLRKSIIDEVGKFNINYPVIADYDYLIRVGLLCAVKSLRSILVTIRLHGDNLSFDTRYEEKNLKNTKEILSDYSEKFDVNLSMLWWDHFRLAVNNPVYVLRKAFRKATGQPLMLGQTPRLPVP